MSRRITAGNDAPFRWAVKLQGKPFDLSGKDVKVYVINSRGEIPVARLTIEGNEVSGVFEGRYQTRLGEHSLVLRVNEGRPEMKTTAVANVFELVQWSTDAGGSDEGDIIVAPIVVESEITAGILAEYTKKDEFDSAVQTISDQLEQKVNMEEGKGLSSNDFTNALKAKLESLSNYDDQELREAINAIESTIDTLIGDNASKKIESFNEIIRFLEGIEDTESLAGIVAGIQQSIAKKADASVVVSLAEEVQTLKTEVESQNELIEDLQNTKIDKEADDYYPQLSVGLADNLSGVDVVDSEVNFRRSGGGAISDGVARIEAIKGNSVVWNQLSKNAASYPNNWHFEGAYEEQGRVTYDSDKHLLALAGKDNATSLVVKLVLNIPTNHKVLVSYGVELKTNVERNGAPILGYFGSPTQWLTNGIDISSVTNKEYRVEKIMSLTSDAKHIFIGLYSGSVSPSYVAEDKMNIYSPLIIDLTKMFGAGNEPTTIEEFYARIPMGVDLNAYNEGEVIHMDVQAIESQGVNAWDGSLFNGYISDGHGGIMRPDISDNKCTGFVRVLPNTQYYIRTDATSGRWGAWYDKDQNFISGLGGVGPHKSPSNAEYMRMTIVYNNDGNPDTFGINISDTSINGKYFPYIKRVEDLAVIRKYFPQGMKSAGSAHDEIRYNKVTQKWEKVVRIGEVDMGTLNWKNLDVANGMFYLSKAGVEAIDMANYYTNDSAPTNLISKKYASAPTYDLNGIDKAFRGPFATLFSGYLTLKDTAYNDAAALKADLQGVILYYELAEPIVTELDAEDQFKDLDYQVWNCGTEKAIAEGKSAPLAADITYGFNAIGKIKELESLVAALRAKVGI